MLKSAQLQEKWPQIQLSEFVCLTQAGHPVASQQVVIQYGFDPDACMVTLHSDGALYIEQPDIITFPIVLCESGCWRRTSRSYCQ